jgi:hypothetical protein
MDFIVLVVSALVFLFSAWFYTISGANVNDSNDEISVKEKKIDNKEKLKEEIVVNYYANNQKEEKISKIDTTQLEKLTENSPKISEQKQPNSVSKANEPTAQTPHSKPSFASVVNPQSNLNTPIKSSQTQQPKVQQGSSFENKSSFGSNNSNMSSSGSFTVVTPPSIPQMSGMDAPPPIPTLAVSNETSQGTSEKPTTSGTNKEETQQTSSSSKLEGPPQIGQ